MLVWDTRPAREPDITDIVSSTACVTLTQPQTGSTGTLTVQE